MRVWAPAKIDEIRKERGMSFQGFVTAMIQVQEKYGITASNNHIRDIVKGRVRAPGATYLALFADVLKCKTDDLFVIKRKK
jgi:transcriptional regulator with XRE-family HTH domain